jgi:hypothetical protein
MLFNLVEFSGAAGIIGAREQNCQEVFLVFIAAFLRRRFLASALRSATTIKAFAQPSASAAVQLASLRSPSSTFEFVF